ncbi:MAG: hypothetical protein ACLU9S_08940 [Oscillospiraceae bacterium]
MYGFETQLVDTIVRFLLGLLGLILLEAAAGVFLGLCVYNDACYRGTAIRCSGGSFRLFSILSLWCISSCS